MRLYLAAPFRKRLEIRAIADKLWNAGFDIVSSWIHEARKPEYLSHTDFMFKLGLKDLCEISMADCVILDARDSSETGGKEVEWGFAIGQWHRKLLVVVGKPRNPFHELADLYFDDWDGCITTMREYYGKGRVENSEAKPGSGADAETHEALRPAGVSGGGTQGSAGGIWPGRLGVDVWAVASEE